MRRTFVGYVTTSPKGATRVLFADNPHHFVDIPESDVTSTEVLQDEGGGSSKSTVTADSAVFEEGWIDNRGYESLFYAPTSHEGLLEDSAFVGFAKPPSWTHTTGYPTCYTRSIC